MKNSSYLQKSNICMHVCTKNQMVFPEKAHLMFPTIACKPCCEIYRQIVKTSCFIHQIVEWVKHLIKTYACEIILPCFNLICSISCKISFKTSIILLNSIVISVNISDTHYYYTKLSGWFNCFVQLLRLIWFFLF